MWTDKVRLDWLENHMHVICYAQGAWFCAWRGSARQDMDGFNWVDRPSADTVRGAIDLAMVEVAGEKRKEGKETWQRKTSW